MGERPPSHQPRQPCALVSPRSLAYFLLESHRLRYNGPPPHPHHIHAHRPDENAEEPHERRAAKSIESQIMEVRGAAWSIEFLIDPVQHK